jgi:mannitol/fructose-specific phosphotransferase system IIA component (Ntr-type)
MQPALYITTTVLPGNRVEVQLPSGSEGQEVNVFIVLPMASSLPLDLQNQTAQLAKMAEDSDIQSELAAINTEFAITQMDGLIIE